VDVADAMVKAVRQAVETTLQKELIVWRQQQQAQQEQMLLELRSWLSVGCQEHATSHLPGSLETENEKNCEERTAPLTPHSISAGGTGRGRCSFGDVGPGAAVG